MIYDSSVFKALEAGVKLSQMQQNLSTQNLANIETPGYKAKRLSFESVLKSVSDKDENGAEVRQINAAVVTDETTTVRTDGNNVSLEAESIALYRAYAQYSMLLTKITSEFENYQYVLNNSRM